MRRLTLLTTALLFIGFSAVAQQGNNQLSVGIDGALPIGDFSEGTSFGIGGTIKGLYGVGSAGQVELTTGYLHFPFEGNTSEASGSTALIPILAGYRHHFNGFFLEPQAGISLVRSQFDIEGLGSSSNSTTAFGWAVGAGYMFDAFEVSARYQSSEKDGGSMGFAGLRIGYNFPF